MKERIVCGAETMSMPGPDTQERAAGPAEDGGEPSGKSEEAGATPNPPSPLPAFLRRSELVPIVLELEKSLLVSREHDYAKAPDRLAVLQATTLLERKSDGPTDPRAGPRGAELCENLLNCRVELGRLRRGLLLRGSGEDGRESANCRHLRAVVGLQASLIREQQEQLYAKDRELASIRKDRDQLEARLERMERRLAVHQKRNSAAPLDSDSSPATPTSQLSSTRRHSRTEALIVSERQSVRSRSSSLERSRNRLRQHSQSTPVSSQEDRRNVRKRLRTDDNLVTSSESLPVQQVKRVKRRPKLTEMRTSCEYVGLGLLPPNEGLSAAITLNHKDCSMLGKNSDSLQSEKHCPNLSNNLVCSTYSTTIAVPSWKYHPLEPIEDRPTGTDLEETSEDVFLRRHKKHEEDEKRRKRWDLQRTRTILEHQELLKKYNKKSGLTEPVEDKRDKLSSFLPKSEDIKELEISPSVVVSAFGHPLPVLRRSDFELPWFDLAGRETRETARTTRSKARSSRTSAGSSDDV